MFVNRVSELELLEKRYASGKAEFLYCTVAGGLARPNSWLVFAKVSARFSLFQIWVQKYLSGRLFPLTSIRLYLALTK